MKKRGMQKKGYFFVIDSLLAMTILGVGMFLIYSAYTNSPDTTDITILSEDMMDFLTQNKISNINNEYAGISGELWNAGNITNAKNTLLQQITLFYETGQWEIAEKFIENITNNVLPAQYNFEVRINRTIIYPAIPSQAHIDSKNRSRILIPSRKIVHGFIDEDIGTMFGPYSAEVMVWQGI